MGWSTTTFERFALDARRRLGRSLVAAYGPDVGGEATAEAMAFAWEHRDRLEPMANPIGYLYRVGQTSARRLRRTGPATFPPVPAHLEPTVEPGLPSALAALTEMQRTCVVLVHGYGYGQTEVAELLEVSASTVRTHLDRALTALRTALEVDHAAG
jgi:DNA-directed RNA polymerase specialized sigma24 family protein